MVSLLAMAGVAQGFGRLSLAFILPGIRADLAGSYAVVGLLVTVTYVAYTAGSYGVRRTSARWTDRQLLRSGLAVQVVSLALLGLAHNTLTAAGAFALSGIASAMVWLSLTALVNVNASPRRRNLAFGATVSAPGLFVAISGWAIAHLPSTEDWPAWRRILIFQAVIAGLCLLASWFAGLKDTESRSAGTRVHGRLRTIRPVWILTAVFLLFGSIQVLFLNYFVAALNHMDMTTDDANRWFALLGLASIVGGLAAGKSIDVIGARLCLLVCLVNVAVCSIVVAWGSPALVPFAAMVFGASIAAIGAASVAYIADSVPAAMVSASFALITVGLGVGQVVSPAVGGLLIDLSGSFAPTYGLCGAVATLGVALTLALPDSRKRTTLDV